MYILTFDNLTTLFYIFASTVPNPDTSKIMTEEFKEMVDEEYYPLVDYVRENIEEFTALDEQQRLQWLTKYFVASTFC